MTSKELTNATFFVIRRTESDTFASVSPFLIQKGLAATVGSVKAVSKMRSGDLLVEVNTTKQAEQLLSLKMLSNIPVTISPHANLNFSRGVISESDLYKVPEEEILEEARLAVTNRTPIQGLSYAAAAKKITKSSTTQTNPVIILEESEEKTQAQPFKTHSPRKDHKKINVKNLKPKMNLKKKPEKNITLKIAREADSLYESSPVSKRSRRRKTFPASDAMDTDVNPSDTDYVIGQASEEDESLLEANFKQAAPDPLTGTLLPSSPKK
ncbi:uncharacterized protein TNCT_678661 [Trichonephila clavata]|uniref:Uncharacterized protein n=1 Tax=Trichonephila clavata TaxID=2740835 RepID=A0A8X6LYD9_TRICU|nr:uncharacterized protein TNCT_678661 [Trichonephila clavata]